MRAVGPPSGITRQPSPLPRGFRVGGLAALALLFGIWTHPAGAQSGQEGWSFEDDAFADLWFHGFATVGVMGFGPAPLYDPGYAPAGRALRAPGTDPSALERAASTFRQAFEGDEAFEVLHFVPLYFRGATQADAMEALHRVAASERGVPPLGPSVRTGGAVVATLLADPAQRRVLSAYLEALDEEWRTVVEPRRAARASVDRGRLNELSTRWSTSWSPRLLPFLDAEDRSAGTVIISTALGNEGRFLDRDPASPSRVLVAVGLPEGEGGLDAALSSLVRELCYPAVRRAFGPFEVRLPNRMDASRASDLAATRCGELLLEERAPEHVAAYRSRFDLPSGGMGRGFLSASGRVPGAAAWEGELDRALRRELHLDLDAVRAGARPVGRN